MSLTIVPPWLFPTLKYIALKVSVAIRSLGAERTSGRVGRTTSAGSKGDQHRPEADTRTVPCMNFAARNDGRVTDAPLFVSRAPSTPSCREVSFGRRRKCFPDR